MAATRVRDVAVFDLDGTLTRRSTLAPFLVDSVPPLRLGAALARTAPHLIAATSGIESRQTAKEALLTACFVGRDVATVRRTAVEFAMRRIPGLLRQEAMRRVDVHRSAGHLLIVATASLELYVEPWASSAGFDAVLATRLEVGGGLLTGRIEGLNCRGPEKVRRLRELLGDLSARTIHAYGDSAGDRELLEVANHRYFRKF